MSRTNRRTFLKTAALGVGAAAFASPQLIPGSALGREEGSVPPSERITMGLIGCGQHGNEWNLPLMLQNPAQQVIAVCDVDSKRMNSAREITNKHYNGQSGKETYDCAAFGDFRDLINRKDIDAVDIVTPDHWHVLISVMAMKAGKDVICEKPTLTIEEGRILSDTQKKTQRVFQTASENRSIDEYQRIVALVRNGKIGELKNIKVLLPPGLVDKGKIGGTFDVSEVPAELNYDMWLGPAPVKPYVSARGHYNWRWNLDYSGGSLTDWGSHMINLAQWANGSDDTGPVEVCGKGDFPDFKDAWNATGTFDINYIYKNGVTMRVWTEVPGVKFEGTNGWVLSRGWRGTTTASEESLLTWKPGPDDQSFTRANSTVTKDNSMGGEHLDFTDCLRNRSLCYYSAECGHRNHTIAHLGNISMKMDGAKLKWNPDKEQFEGDTAAEAGKSMFMKREQRDPWTFANVDSWINVG